MTENPQPRALVIMAHGSRRAAANEEFFNLVSSIGEANSDYSLVKPALLEQAPPTLLEVCQALPADITHIDVYPLFFNQGRHVEKDIPAQVAEVMDALPQKHVRLLEYFGQNQGLAGLVVSHIAQQRPEN
ncbi:sirohydrochlorin cobaltochelatase [Aestuariicella hydrocarbonica]|uniref:Sirohydrochlorin cobaltochelatase n=1 Tax=Pseudomaricurvus hydrocarbonicus TaxID=1470433 RepID=A0A9E5MPG6_9GAMM|nr:CbiX/SirB N-terminal domain-containing protein [Aestuariicella hydrocarbonica]NHO68031.1 sirohydrochlorin cobaltochelatase [Aestuariicella hydrocarbonica]